MTEHLEKETLAIARKRNNQPNKKNDILGMSPMTIGLIAGIVIGAIFAHVEYDKWYLGALVGSGLGPMIALVLQMRFGSD